MTPKVAIVIINWNGYAHTRACLESLSRITYPCCEIIVVDNASTDGSREKLQAEFPQQRFIVNPSNLGFARGCNVGIRKALSGDAAYVLLLNNDTVVKEGFLEPAVALAESDPKIGLVTGKIYAYGRPGHIWYAGGTVSLLRGRGRVRGCGCRDTGQFDRVCEVGYGEGALMLIKRSVLDAIGLLPEEYFFGTEVYDYSICARRRGYKVFYVPEFCICHESGSPARALAPKYLYNGHRSKLIFQQKFLPTWLFRPWELAFLIYSLWVTTRRLERLDRAGSEAFLAALEWAFLDHHDNAGKCVTEKDLETFESRLQRPGSTASGDRAGRVGRRGRRLGVLIRVAVHMLIARRRGGAAKKPSAVSWEAGS